MGQDDSVVHGKHLPPSPRRQPNRSSLKTASAPPPAQGAKPAPLQLQQPGSGQRPGDRHSYSPLMFSRVTPTASPPTYYCRSRTTSESQISPEPPQAPNQTASTNILRRKVLSKETVKQYQEKALHRQGSRGLPEDPGRSRTPSAAQVLWEKVSGAGVGPGPAQTGVRQDRGPPAEIDPMCSLGSAGDSGQAPKQQQQQQ